MTIKERITAALENHNMDADNLDKLLAVAYYMGQEEAARRVSDQYAAHIAQQKERASRCRYHQMALAVVGTEDYLYTTDYAGEVSREFGSDETNF